MQVCCVNPPPVVLPPSDIDRMKEEMNKIKTSFQKINSGTDAEPEYCNIKAAVLTLNEIVYPVDNANDFYKIGGFNLLHPLLSFQNAEVVAATAELIADLCQNNTFCQSKILDLNVIPELVKLLESEVDSVVCSKALYALSSLCRHNEESLKYFRATKICTALMRILQASDDKIRTKAAFFLCYLVNFESFREDFYKESIVELLIQLLHQQQLSTEFVLSALSTLTAHNKQMRIQCREERFGLKPLLKAKIASYHSKQEFQECEAHCMNILRICFSERNEE